MSGTEITLTPCGIIDKAWDQGQFSPQPHREKYPSDRIHIRRGRRNRLLRRRPFLHQRGIRYTRLIVEGGSVGVIVRYSTAAD